VVSDVNLSEDQQNYFNSVFNRLNSWLCVFT
jgi:hypothetical protein